MFAQIEFLYSVDLWVVDAQPSILEYDGTRIRFLDIEESLDLTGANFLHHHSSCFGVVLIEDIGMDEASKASGHALKLASRLVHARLNRRPPVLRCHRRGGKCNQAQKSSKSAISHQR